MAKRSSLTEVLVKAFGITAKYRRLDETEIGCASDGVIIEGTATDVTTDPKRIEDSRTLQQPIAERQKKNGH
jgi:hypothetical protein